jgi:hypothetical protein
MGCAVLRLAAPPQQGLRNNRFHFLGVPTLYKIFVQTGRHIVIRPGKNWLVNEADSR